MTFTLTTDRTPKQKLKVKVTAEPLLAMFQRYKDKGGKQAKLKTPLQLQELLDVTKEQLLVRSNGLSARSNPTYAKRSSSPKTDHGKRRDRDECRGERQPVRAPGETSHCEDGPRAGEYLSRKCFPLTMGLDRIP